MIKYLNLTFASKSIKGRRNHMEDYFSNDTNNKFSIFSIFDGHGGKSVSFYCAKNFNNYLKTNIKKNITNKEITELYYQFDKNFKKYNKVGSTAVTVIFYNNFLYFLNLGDSKAFLYNLEKDSILYETKTHKPSMGKEFDRIHDVGHVVIDNRINGCLNLSRAFGDFNLKKSVISKPSIFRINLTKSKEDLIKKKYYIVIGSDGVFDYIDKKIIINILRNENDDLNYKCKKIIKDCYTIYNCKDNITLTLIKFNF